MGGLHRDIKPENLLFPQGHPIVGDFGIAKAASTAGGANLTRTGFQVGPPGYMSPEQAAGLTDLDERTDVYSLAVVVYEMLVGDVPGRWPTEDAVRAGRFLEASVSHRTRLTSIGASIEGALVRGRAIRQDQRTATTAGLIDELTCSGSGHRRRYDKDEVQEIVKRATEMEATNKTVSGAMTIGGVQALAGEVGVAPEVVRAAAESLQTPYVTPGALPPNRTNNWVGGPTELLFERVIEGELPESEYATVVEEIRRVLRNAGQVSQFGRSFSWIAARGPAIRRDLEVAVSVRRGQTRVTIQENLNQLMGAVFGGIGGGMGGGGMGPVICRGVCAFHLVRAAGGTGIPVWPRSTHLTPPPAYRPDAQP